ncbi:hypothetical protein NHX12_023056, partial [Muraenolepis orangiensis]
MPAVLEKLSLYVYESEKPAAQAASEDDQLVGFGNYAKSTWREVWDNRADGFASFILRTKTHSGSRMYRLQQYLRKKVCLRLLSTSSCLKSWNMDMEKFSIVSVCVTVMDDDEELERAMLSITPSKLQVHSFAVPVAAAAIPGVSPGAKTVPPPALSKPASGTTAELRASPVDAPGRKRKTPVPLPPQLTFLVKETAGSIKAERPESSDDMTSWSCSQHQKLWMRTELQDLGLWPGSPPVRNPGNAISL